MIIIYTINKPIKSIIARNGEVCQAFATCEWLSACRPDVSMKHSTRIEDTEAVQFLAAE